MPKLWPLVFALTSFAASGADLRLVEAAKDREAQLIPSLMKQGADVNATQPDGSTALAWAVHWNDLKTADLLIGAGANVNAVNDYGVTPLWEACNNGSPAMVAKLAAAGANPNSALPGSGETALMTCSRTGNVDAVKSLLDRGANPNAKEKQKGQTALMWALEERHSDVARLLIERGADIHAKTKGGFTPLLFAARQGDLISARMLVEHGADVNEKLPAQRIVGGGSYGNVNGGGDSAEAAEGAMTPLLLAAASAQEAFAVFLVEHGADVNAADPDGLTALHYAVRKGHTILMFNQHHGDGGASYGFGPNMPKLVSALLEHGANPNARIVKGNKMNPRDASARPQLVLAGATPFLLAAATGDVGIMKALLAKGADPKLATADHATPLIVAAGGGRKDIRTKEEEKQAVEAVKFLVELGLDVNAATDQGLTALHGAAFTWLDGAIPFLVEHGARLNVEDKWGQTPLSIALGDPNNFVDGGERSAHSGSESSTAKLILKLGADPMLRGSPYLTSGK